MKILLLGKNGQLGWELQRSLAPLGEVCAPGRAQGGDLEDTAALVEMVQREQPQVIVNAAAYTAVDRAETETEIAMQVNAAAPAALALLAQDMGALLVHYSSDYVYDGSGSHARTEDEEPGPLSAYGRSKLEGDLAIEHSGCAHLILRTSWVYAARGGNFAKTMLRLAAEREELSVINDQIGAPTGADLLADLSAHMIRHTLVQPQLVGLYHVAATGSTNWHGYACHVIEQAERLGAKLKVRATEVRALSTDQYPTAAPRPMNSRLSCEKLRARFGLSLPDWRLGVDRMLMEILRP